MTELVPIGTLLAAIAGLFTLLIRSQDKRAEDAIARAVAAETLAKEAREDAEAARDRVEAVWERTATMLHETNGKLATITQALIDQRSPPQRRT